MICNKKNNYVESPDNIIVIGGGRWSRVFIGILCDLVHPSVRISVHSKHCVKSMLDWAVSKGIENRIYFSTELPNCNSMESNAIIVVNAARDHEKTVEWALSADIPVLVEKPIALSSVASQRLSRISQQRNVCFAAAHVFLYSGYINQFSEIIAAEENISCLNICWSDPQSENRYGESKQFDQSLPIFSDWLPHVFSILSMLVPILPDMCEKVVFQKGGSHVILEFMCGDIPCNVELIRNGDKRQRIIEAYSGQKKLQLDFSKEPGIITCGSTTMSGDIRWDIEKRPVSQMLTAFLQWVTIGKNDTRLNIDVGLLACKVIDYIGNIYSSERNSWLISKLESPVTIDEDLHYALSEILQYKGRLTQSILEQQINQVVDKFNGPDCKLLLEELSRSNDPVSLFKTILM